MLQSMRQISQARGQAGAPLLAAAPRATAAGAALRVAAAPPPLVAAPPRRQQQRANLPARPRAAADPQQPQQPPQPQPPAERKVVYNTEFGYSRKDIFLIGGGLIGLGYAMYYGLQATGMEPGIAGNWVQAIIFLGICVGWVSTYLYRVATKQMTYVKQLEMYEDAVIRKRMEEMTEAQVADLMAEVEAERARRGAGRKAAAGGSGGGSGAPGGSA